MTLFPRKTPSDVLRARQRPAVDEDTLAVARQIFDEVETDGDAALRQISLRLGDLPSVDAPLLIGPASLAAAFARLPPKTRALLDRTSQRIEAFAQAQRQSLGPITVPIPGGSCGLDYAPVQTAGCYAPGGRYPLPSSVLMTALTARAAGVAEVWVASPRPSDEVLAAAHLSGATGVLAVGGAQAIAAMALGKGGVSPCDVIVGPGNRFVTAAKKLVAGDVRIDMLAGPSELLVVADAESSPALVAADLLAQAEHDPDAQPLLVTTSKQSLAAVETALAQQLATLSTAAVATDALANGGAVLVSNLDEAILFANAFAPEHLSLHIADAASQRGHFRNYGAVFLGESAAEVLADYGAGPNHVLPTGGCAKAFGGLNVQTFCAARSWLKIDDAAAAGEIIDDAAALAAVEGLQAHALAAKARRELSAR